MKEKLKFLILGGGGRESALAWKISLSPRMERLYIAPGNGDERAEHVDLKLDNFDSIKEFVDAAGVDLIVVGPEVPLVKGIADYLKDSGVKVIGPCREGAAMEGSKEFAKEFMFRHSIPTARFMTVTSETLQEGYSFLESLNPPYVLKADGLAAGKGVVILPDLEEAKDTLAAMLDGMFGKASETVVIEQYLDGVECSVFVATDGEEYKVLPVAKDYKRIGDNDEGPNTGGMGAVSPVVFADEEFMDKVRRQIIEPTLNGLRQENIDYRGFLFLGLMNVDGDPYVIEYNVRLGDPETEVVLPRISSDITDIFEGIADCTLGLKKIETDPRTAATVMLVSKGYPGPYEKGKVITGLEKVTDAIVFQAGTKRLPDGTLVTDGGRVLSVTAYGDTTRQAVEKAMQQASLIEFEGKTLRTDIGRDLERIEAAKGE